MTVSIEKKKHRASAKIKIHQCGDQSTMSNTNPMPTAHTSVMASPPTLISSATAAATAAATAMVTLNPHSQIQVTKPAINDDTAKNNDVDDNTKKKKKHKKRKASLGRLKKLWRRATINTATSSPGITSRADWVELMELHTEWKERQDKERSGHFDGTENVVNENLSNTPNKGNLNYEAMMGPLPGPSVILSSASKQKINAVDFGKSENWQITEGTDHRDILLNLLFGSTDDGDNDDGGNVASKDYAEGMRKKKRKLNNSPGQQENSSREHKNVPDSVNTAHTSSHVPALPSWANITNIAGVGGVAVVEIHINDDVEGNDSCPLMPSQLIKNATQTNNNHANSNDNSGNIWNSLISANSNNISVAKRTIGSACKVKLFQGDKYPRSLSDILMYLPQNQQSKQQNKGKIDEIEANGLDRDEILFNALQALKLTKKQLRSEGFPLIVAADDVADNVGRIKAIGITTGREAISAMPSDQRLGLISREDALKLVKDLAVNVEFGYESGLSIDKKESDEFGSLEYYVQTFRHGSDDMPSSSRKPKIYAMDCEMVKTIAGPELARVSLIEFSRSRCGDHDECDEGVEANEKSVVVLDELVKPRRPVLDYLSGRFLHSIVIFSSHSL